MKFATLWGKARLRGGPVAGRTLVWDGDIVLYNAVWNHMREERVDGTDELVWLLDQAAVLEDVRARVDETQRELRAESSTFCFGSRSNWRTSVLPTYKAHRDGKKPLGWYAILEVIKSEYPCLETPGLEGDDVCGLIHTAPGAETVTVSEDKDFRQLPGLHFNPRKPQDGIVKISSQEATHWHMLQALAGDPTDNYSGCPGVGEVGANKALPRPDRGMSDEGYQVACWAAVLALYAKKGLDERDALVQARVARILRHGEWDADAKEVRLWTPS